MGCFVGGGVGGNGSDVFFMGGKEGVGVGGNGSDVFFMGGKEGVGVLFSVNLNEEKG